MPSGELSLYSKSNLKAPLLWGNLLLRLCLVAYVISTQHWSAGDSYEYIENAKSVCSGNWGGETFRPPFYAWYLCALSIHGPYSYAIPLILQTLIIWGVGLYLYKRGSQWLAPFWLYEPAMLAYSNLLMPDVIFSVAVFFLGIFVYSLTQNSTNTSYKSYLWFGMSLGWCALIKSIAIPFVFLNLLLAFIWLFKNKFQKSKQVLLACCIFLLMISPKLYWNVSRFHEWTLASQGKGWLGAVAGVVQNEGQGLDFLQAEIKFFKEHPEQYHSNDTIFYTKTILSHFPTWLKLTTKGFLRVLLGHVNAEYALLWSGVAPVGPGWFKVKDHREGAFHVEGGWIWLWILGLLITTAFCIFVYLKTYQAVLVSKSYQQPFVFWFLTLILFFAFIPQVYGDARFRIPLWPLVLLMWEFSYESSSYFYSAEHHKNMGVLI